MWIAPYSSWQYNTLYYFYLFSKKQLQFNRTQLKHLLLKPPSILKPTLKRYIDAQSTTHHKCALYTDIIARFKLSLVQGWTRMEKQSVGSVTPSRYGPFVTAFCVINPALCMFNTAMVSFLDRAKQPFNSCIKSQLLVNSLKQSWSLRGTKKLSCSVNVITALLLRAHM